jgi:hypothetical protein
LTRFIQRNSSCFFPFPLSFSLFSTFSLKDGIQNNGKTNIEERKEERRAPTKQDLVFEHSMGCGIAPRNPLWV